MGEEIILTDENFEREVLQANIPVLVDFWAPWCGSCQILAPTISEIASEYAGKVKICKLNTDENQLVAAKYRISAIPTLIFFKQGRITDQSIGLVNKQTIRDKLDRLL